MPLLEAKFRRNLARRFVEKRCRAILDVSLDRTRLEPMAVNAYVDLYAN
jgi:2-methylcitrate dehydratase